jgi:probable F420-dependent oxidoreductase
MRYYLDYQLHAEDGGAWLDPENMRTFALACEEAGVGAIALTDHPAPSRKWLDAGGHDTFDPFAGLSFFAASTKTLRLMTYLAVVPYRNPFLLAKAMTTLDVVSGGRATFTLGTGYMRSEFLALGVDMDQRNELFDESMDVVRGLLESPAEFHHAGKRFTGKGVALSPPPVQRPRPPLWLGGNAKVVRERVAAWGNGWAPLTLGGSISGKVSRTAPIPDLQHLARQIEEIRMSMADLDRDPSTLDVASPGIALVKPTDSSEQKLAHIEELVEAGVTWTSVPYEKLNFRQALEDIAAFGEEVVSRVHN